MTDNIMAKLTKGNGQRETAKDRQYHGQRETDHIMGKLTDNIMAKAKDRQTGQKTDNIMAKGKLPKLTDNIMAKAELTKDRQYHGQRETDKKDN